jgi:hypothetical protein
MNLLKKRSALIALVVALLLALAAAGAWFFFSKTPEYALTEAGLAFKGKDWQKFSRHVDLHSILDHGADDLLEEYITLQGIDPQAAKLARNAVRFIKPQLISFMEEQIKSTYFSESNPQNPPQSAPADPDTQPRPSSDRLKFDRMETVHSENDTAIVTAHFHPESSPTEERIIQIKMVKQEDNWRAIQILNLNEVIQWPEAKEVFTK